MSDIYVQSCSSAESAFEVAEYLTQRGFEVHTHGPGETISVNSTTMNEGSFATGTDGYIIIGTK
jgi:hypothetical protein